MDLPKYDGNIHPDEWIKDIKKYDEFWKVILESKSLENQFTPRFM